MNWFISFSYTINSMLLFFSGHLFGQAHARCRWAQETVETPEGRGDVLRGKKNGPLNKLRNLAVSSEFLLIVFGIRKVFMSTKCSQILDFYLYHPKARLKKAPTEKVPSKKGAYSKMTLDKTIWYYLYHVSYQDLFSAFSCPVCKCILHFFLTSLKNFCIWNWL